MKKLLLCAMMGILVFSVCACGRNSVDAEKLAAPTLTDTTAGETVSTSSGGGQTANDATAASVPVVTDVPDLVASVDAETTSDTNAVPLGEWAKTTIYSAQDETYRTVYVRVVKVTTESADEEYVSSAIALNNRCGKEEDQIDRDEMEIGDGSELVVVDYDVYIPAEFPAPSYGMPEPKLILSTREINESGMGLTTQLVVRDASESYHAGGAYRERSLYTMKKDKTNYVIAYSTYPVGTPGEETSTDNMYTAYHSLKPAETTE